MITETTEKGLEAHITQHLCLMNAFDEMHFSDYNRVDFVDEDFAVSNILPSQIVSHIKTETTTIDTAIAKTEREIELIRECKEAMVSEAVMGKRLVHNLSLKVNIQ